MTRQDTGLNLLFGVIALQLDLIDANRFAEACSAWAARKETPLADLLLERGWITSPDRDEIEKVLRRKIDRHGGDACRSLDEAVDHSVGALVSSVVIDEGPDLGFAINDGGAAEAVDRAAETVDAPRVDGPSAGMRGRFRLVRMYAKGGLGQVWLARDPVLGREVALKELRPEKAADATSRARFLREARITGRLEHPGIVTVHELAGPGGDRQAFYSMQLLRGRTLREAVRDYHDRHGSCPGGVLELHALLEDFVAVCNAVAYAHSRGVIHRDLKGQNIVLGDFGEVVVLDWGLAKVVGQPGTATVAGPSPDEVPGEGVEGLTLEGQRMGTPGFMAPEQAEGRHELVGVGSDIYGLGAILYEILTGRPPFADSGVDETLRRVREEDPEPPRLICSDIPAALESICLKALAKRPGDRYLSASDMAQDVRRWLADEPVSAYREPVSERLGRWGRRHRSALAAGAALLLVVVAGLVVVVLASGREQARTRAALALEARQRKQAEANFTLAREAVDHLYDKVLENPLLSEPKMDPLRLALIRTTKEFYVKLVGLASEDSRLREHLAGSYLSLSRVTLRAGEVDQAVGQVRKALEIYEELAATHPGRDHFRGDVAQCYLDLAECHRDASRPDEAEAAYDRAIAIWSKLVKESKSPRYAWCLATAYDCLGSLDRSVGKWDRAATAHLEALAIFRRLADEAPPSIDRERTLDRLASCLNGLACIAKERGNWAEAETRFRQAYETWTGLQAARHGESNLSELASLLGGWSQVRAATGRPAEARAMRERALEEWTALAKEHPETVQYQDCIATEHMRIGEFLEAEKPPTGVASHYEAALAIWKQLAPRYPGRPDLAFSQAKVLFRLGHLHESEGRRVEAAACYREARSIWEKMGGKLREDYERDHRAALTRALADLDDLPKPAGNP